MARMSDQNDKIIRLRLGGLMGGIERNEVGAIDQWARGGRRLDWESGGGRLQSHQSCIVLRHQMGFEWILTARPQ